MTTAGEISVELNGKDVNLSSLLIKVDQQAQKAADSAIRLQAQYARLANTQGNTAGATALLTNALKNNGGASEQALLGVANQLSGLQKGFQGGASYAQQFGAAAKSSLLGIVGPAAAASVALGSIVAVGRSFADAFKLKAELDSTTASVKSQLQGFRDVNATYSQAIAFGRQYNITQQETTAILSSSTDILRTSTASVRELETALIRLQSKSPEKPISEASRALRELASGDTTSIKELFQIPAKDANKMKAEILAGGDAVKVLTGYLDGAKVGMDALALRTQGAAGEMKALALAQEDLALAQAEFAQGPGKAFLEEQTRLTLGLTRALGGGGGLSEAFNQIGAAIQGQIAYGNAYTAAIQAGQSRSEARATALRAEAEAASIAAYGTQAATAATIQHATAYDEDRVALGAVQAAIQQKAEADQNAATQSQIASVNAQTLALANTQLAQQAQLAAGAMIASGNGGAAAAARLAGSSSLVDQLTAAYLRLAAAQGQATQAKLNTQTARQLIGAGSDEAELRAGKSTALRADRQARIQQTQAAQRAEENYQRALGNNAPAIGRANRELAQLTKGTAAYYDKLTEITNLEKNGKKGGGVGGKAAKLSDQQKLNNSLLADQEKFNEKFEDTDAKHALKRLEIQQDYAEKARQAEIAFSDDQFESRASFYDRLSSIESGKIQQASSQAYEQAAAEAGKIAAEKGADVADRYMAEQEKVILARAERLAAIETAQNGDKDGKNKDLGRAEYLKGVDALYQQSEDRRIERIKEGNDSIAAERAKALADEDRQYEQATGTIADKAETSAARRIAAAERAGKAIDAEAAKLTSLGQAYDRAGGGRPATPDSPATPAASSTSATGAAPAAPADIGQLIAKLDELRAALVGATERGSRDIVGAVGSLRGGSVFAG